VIKYIYIYTFFKKHIYKLLTVSYSDVKFYTKNTQVGMVFVLRLLPTTDTHLGKCVTQVYLPQKSLLAFCWVEASNARVRRLEKARRGTSTYFQPRVGRGLSSYCCPWPGHWSQEQGVKQSWDFKINFIGFPFQTW